MNADVQLSSRHWMAEQAIDWMESHPDVLRMAKAGDPQGSTIMQAYWQTWIHPGAEVCEDMRQLAAEWDAQHV